MLARLFSSVRIFLLVRKKTEQKNKQIENNAKQKNDKSIETVYHLTQAVAIIIQAIYCYNILNSMVLRNKCTGFYALDIMVMFKLNARRY